MEVDNENFTELVVLDINYFLRIVDSTKTRIINVGLQQLHEVGVKRGLAILLG